VLQLRAFNSPVVDRSTSAQVGQCKRVDAVAAIGRADQTEQHVILRDGQRLAIALQPSDRREIEANREYLANIRLRHRVPQILSAARPQPVTYITAMPFGIWKVGTFMER